MGAYESVVVGAGHAGLSVSKLLTDSGIEHVVLEKSRIASRWRDERWDSFTLLTPNWATWLPDWHYEGPDPHGFMGREEVGDYFLRFAESFRAPVREGLAVTKLARDAHGFTLQTDDGPVEARSVVVATGPFQAPRIPEWASALPAQVHQLHSSGYRNAASLPDGAVLVVGAGPSGQQIVDDLRRAGREVFLAVGHHRRAPRRYRGRDIFWWYELGGFYEKTAEDLPADQPRGNSAVAVLTGYNGGQDLDLRELAAKGVTLLGRASGYADGSLTFLDNLTEMLADGDQGYAAFTDWVESRLFKFEGLYDEITPRETFPDPPPAPTSLALADRGITAIVWATGFQPDYTSWIAEDIFDDAGYPVHRRGVTSVPGLYFTGLPWLHRLRSPFIRGAEEDARHLVAQIRNAS